MLNPPTDNPSSAKVSKDHHATTRHHRMATALRFLAVDAVNQANSGHPGMPLGMADVATVLLADVLMYNPADPTWPNRDRLVLSAGHGAMLLYGLLHLTGYEAMTLEQIKNFRQWGSITSGHPEVDQTHGVETTTGPLGQGLANAVGMALAERVTAARFGSDLVHHFTYCVVGDGCLMEGIAQEAISFAGHLKLNKLIVLHDDNGITIDGSTALSTSEDMQGRFEAAGWAYHSINGHDYAQISQALQTAQASDRPTLIACKTIIGYGSPNKAGSHKVHGSPLGPIERQAMAEALGWEHDFLSVPDDVYDKWAQSLERIKAPYDQWQEVFSQMPHSKKDRWHTFFNKNPQSGYVQAIEEQIAHLFKTKPQIATRIASQQALEVISPYLPNLLGGSADLTSSNNTDTQFSRPIDADDFTGNYLYYGIREHAMGAIMNGLSLHGGFIPYGGTFLVFSDYMRPAIRLAALMNIQVIYVFTHDSIGLGEDGPTHQPIEHLASLRAMPRLHVFRPCDAVETMESWQIAVSMQNAPSVLALSRQALPLCRTLETHEVYENKTINGGYIMREAADHKPRVVLLATGSEVFTALEVQGILMNNKIGARVVSVPCWELFDQQPLAYRQKVLGEPHLLRVSIEAGSTMGWERYVGDNGLRFGLDDFGASAPAPHLYRQYGLTGPAIAEKILEHLAAH